MISVIVPVFNTEEYLDKCLESIARQTFADLQIIVVDDGSTDGSGGICEAWAARDSRFQVIHQENRGLSAARNRGIGMARGEYLCFVDSDDFLLPDCLETLLKLCADHGADMSVCSHIYLNISEVYVPRPQLQPAAEPEVFSGPRKMSAYLREGKLCCVAWAKLYSASLFQTIRYPEGRVFEDAFVFHMLAHAAGRIAVTQKPGYVYRKRSGSITEKPSVHCSSERLEAYLALMAFTEKEYPSLLPYAHVTLVNACITQLWGIYKNALHCPEMIRRLRSQFRKHFLSYLRYEPSLIRRLFASAVCISPALVWLPLRIYGVIRKKRAAAKTK